VFLWAGIPVIVVLLFKSVRMSSSKASLSLICLAGFQFGVLYSIRYASLFMGVAAALILMQISLPSLKTMALRFAAFGVSAGVIILPVFLYTKTYSESILPAYVNVEHAIANIDESALAFSYFLPVIANVIFGVPAVEQVIYKINFIVLTFASGLLCLAVIFAVPVSLARNSIANGSKLKDDTALGLSLLPLALVASITMANPFFLGVRRYYEPVALCGVLVAYEILHRRGLSILSKVGASVVVATFAAYMILYMPGLAFSHERRGHLISSVVGYTPARDQRYQSTSQDLRYPDAGRIFSRKESSRQKLQELYRANPHALFFVEEYAYFIYDGFVAEGLQPGVNVRVYPSVRFWEHAYTSAPVKVFWVVEGKTNLSFVAPDNLKTVYSDKFETTKILESTFPECYQFSVNALAQSTPKSTNDSNQR